jgi:dipeptidyl aminopeptidase/acylaminoacyl peptidase
MRQNFDSGLARRGDPIGRRACHGEFISGCLSIIIALTLGGSVAAAGAEESGFTAADVLSAPFPSELRAAPTGDKVAWVSNDHGARNIWVADAAGAATSNAHLVTDYRGDDGIDIGHVRWSRSAEFIVYVRGGSVAEGGGPVNALSLPEGVAPQEVWIAPTSGTEPHRLGLGHSPEVSPKNDRVAYICNDQIWLASTSGADQPIELIRDLGKDASLSWSPDGQRLAFVSSRGDHELIGIYNFSKKDLVWMTPSVDSDAAPTWSPDGRSLAFIRLAASDVHLWRSRPSGQPWSIWVGDTATGNARSIWTAAPGSGSVFRELLSERQLFWAKGGRIVFPWEQSGWLHLYAVEISTGRVDHLTPGDFEVFSATLSPMGDQLVYSANRGDLDGRHLWKSAVIEPGAKPITSGKTIEDLPELTGDGHLVALQADARTQLHPVGIDNGGRAHPLSSASVPAAFPLGKLVVPQPVTYSSPDGLVVHAQLFAPPATRTPSPRAAIVFFHGGPTRQMLSAWNPLDAYAYLYGLNQYLASKGYIVLSVNYRGGTGYGLNFREPAGFGSEGASEYQDVLGAAHYLRSRTDVDSRRLGVYGVSYGGLMTGLALGRSSDLFAAGVDWAGVSNRRTFILAIPGLQPPGDLAFSSSPIASASEWRSPVLFVHGDDDRDVSFDQTVELIKALREQHRVQIEQLVLPNELHDLMLHRSWETAFTSIADFFDKHLR